MAITNSNLQIIGVGKVMPTYIRIFITNTITMICIYKQALDHDTYGKMAIYGWQVSHHDVGMAGTVITGHTVES